MVSRARKTEIVTTLKRQATRLLADVRETKEPVLITEHGKPSAYLVDAASFDLMRDRMTILEGIARGERALNLSKPSQSKPSTIRDGALRATRTSSA